MNAKVAVFGLCGVVHTRRKPSPGAGSATLYLWVGDVVEEATSTASFSRCAPPSACRRGWGNQRIKEIITDCAWEAEKLFYLPGEEGLIDGCCYGDRRDGLVSQSSPCPGVRPKRITALFLHGNGEQA